MPTVHRIGSTKIDVYSRDHLPPHFHALYGCSEALIVLKTLVLYAGDLPVAQLRSVRQWANKEDDKNMLLENWYGLNPNLRK